jgi:uncharacterized damage-inducible protein DinB
MDPRLAPLADILRLNTRLVLNCCDGMSEEQARLRASERTNHTAFLLAHLIDTRHFVLRMFGGSAENPVAAMLDGARGIDEVRSLPSLTSLNAAWHEISAVLDERFRALDGSSLDAPSPERFPIDDDTILGALAFLVQHDSYHVGQLAMLRRVAGLPAMRYGSPSPV